MGNRIQLSKCSDTSKKIVGPMALRGWRVQVPPDEWVVATNGCFDILHAGHIAYLEEAKRRGDWLVVGVNSDASVRQLKGDGRPINNQDDRARIVAALEAVDFVYIFDELRATEFLTIAQPTVWAKGGDYTLETLDVSERDAVLKLGGTIQLIPPVPGKSTTAILAKAGA